MHTKTCFLRENCIFYQLAKVFFHERFRLYGVTSSRCRNLHDVFLILTVVDCGNLTDIANGQVDHTAGTTFKQTATYSCNTGYNLVGDSIRTCQAIGNWSGSASTCLGILLSNIIYETSGILFATWSGNMREQ